MPRYDFKCLDCGHIFEVICSSDQLNNTHSCPDCLGFPAKQYFGNHKVTMVPPMQPFFDLGEGRWVSSKSEIKDIESREGKVFGGHKELLQEAEKNRRALDSAHTNALTEKIIDGIVEVGKKYNV